MSLQPSRTRSVDSLEPLLLYPHVLLRKAAVARLLFLGLVGFFASTRVQIFVHFVDDVCVLEAMAERAVAPFTLPLTLLYSNTHTRVAHL